MRAARLALVCLAFLIAVWLSSAAITGPRGPRPAGPAGAPGPASRDGGF